MANNQSTMRVRDDLAPHDAEPSQSRRVSVAIVGGGQAGLSVSRQLYDRGIDHVVFERHRRFHSWRVNLWDTFCRVTTSTPVL